MQPPVIYQTGIEPQWLDYNGHMNVAYYVLIFDRAGERLIESIGMGEEYTAEQQISWMVLENHITYNAEVGPQDEVEVSVQLIDHDAKRLHLYFEMHQCRGERYLASTLEQMVMCVDLNQRRGCPFPEPVRQQIESLAEQYADLPRPAGIGRQIGIRRR